MSLKPCVGVFGIMLVVCYGQASNRHMICKDVNDVFSENGEAVSHPRRLQGPSGEKGVPGMKGDPGSPGIPGRPGIPGQPGIVDYDRLNELVRASVKSEIRELQSKVEKIEHYINSTKEEEHEPAITADKCSSTYGGFIYDRKCYWGEVRTRKDTDLVKGKQLCIDKGSTLADIYSKGHFDSAMNYLRSKMPPLRVDIVVWTAMKKKFEDPVAYLSVGEAAEYTKVRSSSTGQWFPAERSRTQVYLFIRTDTKHADQGMGAIYPSYNAWGVLCRVV